MYQTASQEFAAKTSAVMPADCSIRSVGAIAETVRNLLGACESARLDCGQVEAADLTFVQLVASARSSFEARGLSVTVENASPAVLAAFTRAGVPAA